jgi:hypothetical protein
MAMQDPADGVRKLVNTPSDNPPRAEGGNFAVYSDGVLPVTQATVSPSANANGWNNTNVTVSLTSTDERSGMAGHLPGWVDEVRYSLAGAQTSDLQVVPGSSATVGVTTPGITTLTYFATDAADNDEAPQALTLRLDGAPPAIQGLPAAGCTLWPPNHKMQQVAVVSATDAVSGVAPGSLQVTATSSEPSDDEDVRVSADGAGGFVVELRAERQGSGQRRLYWITATARDLAGNAKTATATCVVPHDQGKK